METSVQKLGRRTGNFAEMLFCCPVLFIFFSASCSAGQWLRRHILTLVSHTYQKHFALGISLLPWSLFPFMLSFSLKWKDINYSVEILHVLVWRALHWSCPNLSITAIQEQLQITLVFRVGSIKKSHWCLRGLWLKQLTVLGKGEERKSGSGLTLYLYSKCGRRNTKLSKHTPWKNTHCLLQSSLLSYKIVHFAL